MLLSFERVSFGYTDVKILEDVTFSLHEGEKVGLLGPNGKGKTTLLKLITGELSPDEGKIFLKNGLKAGYLEQVTDFSSSLSAYDALKEVFKEDEMLIESLYEAQKSLSFAGEEEQKKLSSRIESLTKRIAARDSYHFEVKIRTVLSGMGLENMAEQKVCTMSGGEKTKLKLCKLLLTDPDLLILDEPTNHLDLKTLFFLEEYLSSLKGALLVVSHDRYFLDKLTSRTLDLCDGQIISYKGNYSKYKILQKERYEEELKAYEAQQEEIAKLNEYIAKNGVRASTAKSAHARENKLERMTLLKKPTPPSRPPKFSFTFTAKPYEKVVYAPKFTLKAQDKVLLEDASFTLLRGEKCALMGDNGTGKSTLLKFLFKESNLVTHGGFARVALFDQERENFDPLEEVYAHFERTARGLTQSERRAALARCGLGEEDIFKNLGSLSGGQFAKYKLLLLEVSHANVLFLDEPTNHLDLASREALEEALKVFEGTLLFVSHDRRFIEAVADRIATIEDGKLEKFEGDFKSFLTSSPLFGVAQKKQENSPKVQDGVKKQTEGYKSKEEKREQARMQARTREIEKAIQMLEEEQAKINDELLKLPPSEYKRAKEISLRLEEIEREMEKLYDEYEKLL